MIMNGMPIDIFSALQTYTLERAEKNNSREAAAMVEKGDTKYRMYLTLSIDPKDFGRTYECETEKGGEIIHHSSFTYYGGAKR